MSVPKIVVVGSSNIDMVIKTERIPAGGETVLGEGFVMVPGGKGANQAVCAAKLGADVKLVARIGDDVFGEKSLENFKSVGIDCACVKRDPSAANGVALIAVDANGENAIVVAPGANRLLSCEDVENARGAIAEADAVVLQLEIPAETVACAIRIAKEAGTRVVLNPAPIRPMPGEVLADVDILIPNQHEAADLLGNAGGGRELDAPQAAAELLKRGPKAVIVTLGGDGAYVADSSGCCEFIPAKKVDAVDTTAAGDAFTASVACAIAEGMSLADAARFATAVSAVVVTRMGAQSSMPLRSEIDF